MPIPDWSMLPRLVVAAFILFALAAALHDLIARTVPNLCCAAIAVLGICLRLADHSLAIALAAAAAAFLAAALCWRAGWLGGGDVKLLAALCLAVPPSLVLAFLAYTSIAGTALAFIYLLARGRVRASAITRATGLAARAIRAERWRLSRGGPLPYAVAIAAGAIIVLTRGAVS